jgi:hypothetical protein
MFAFKLLHRAQDTFLFFLQKEKKKGSFFGTLPKIVRMKNPEASHLPCSCSGSPKEHEQEQEREENKEMDVRANPLQSKREKGVAKPIFSPSPSFGKEEMKNVDRDPSLISFGIKRKRKEILPPKEEKREETRDVESLLTLSFGEETGEKGEKGEKVEKGETGDVRRASTSGSTSDSFLFSIKEKRDTTLSRFPICGSWTSYSEEKGPQGLPGETRGASSDSLQFSEVSLFSSKGDQATDLPPPSPGQRSPLEEMGVDKGGVPEKGSEMMTWTRDHAHGYVCGSELLGESAATHPPAHSGVVVICLLALVVVFIPCCILLSLYS